MIQASVLSRRMAGEEPSTTPEPAPVLSKAKPAAQLRPWARQFQTMRPSTRKSSKIDGETENEHQSKDDFDADRNSMRRKGILSVELAKDSKEAAKLLYFIFFFSH